MTVLQNVGSNPDRSICVSSKTRYCTLLLFTQEYKWVPLRVEVDIVFGKGLPSATFHRGCILPGELRKITGMMSSGYNNCPVLSARLVDTCAYY